MTATHPDHRHPRRRLHDRRRRPRPRAGVGLDRRRRRRARPHPPPAAARRRSREGETDAAAAVAAYYGGDISAIDGVEVAQRAPRCSSPAGRRCARIDARAPLTYAEFAAALGPAERCAGRGIHLRAQRARAVRAVPPRAALGRLARRVRVGARRQAQPARARSGRLTQRSRRPVRENRCPRENRR